LRVEKSIRSTLKAFAHNGQATRKEVVAIPPLEDYLGKSSQGILVQREPFLPF
jgi:hypothetical protein